MKDFMRFSDVIREAVFGIHCDHSERFALFVPFCG